jgi:large subunit ribosomal protein L23
VKVDQVRTINFMGKTARRGRFEGRKPSWKKAYVTLKQGEKPVDYGEAI